MRSTRVSVMVEDSDLVLLATLVGISLAVHSFDGNMLMTDVTYWYRFGIANRIERT